MTYRNVKRKRLAWLVGNGLSPEELRKFFKEKRAPLVLAGVKVQVAPANSDDAINHILRFDSRANAVFAAWLTTLKVEAAAPYEGQVLPYVKAIESLQLKLPAPDIHKLARLGLKDLFSESPNQAWLDFLQTDIHDETAPDTAPSEPPAAEQRRIAIQDIEALGEWLTNSRTVQSLPQSPWTEAIGLIQAIKTGDLSGVEPHLLSDEVRVALQAEHAKFKAVSEVRVRNSFSVIQPPLATFDSSKNYLSKDIIATYASGSGPYFLDVLAFMDDESIFSLDEADLRRVLPEEGRLILHVDARLELPVPGVAETYHVERYPTGRSIKCKAVRHGRRLLEVVFVPHASNEHDAVRNWIAESLHTPNAGRAPHVYVLADQVCIRAKNDGRPSSDWTFDLWNSLRGVQLGGRAYLAEPLPPADGEYECQPPSTIAKRYLRTLSEIKSAKYTKQQLADLANHLTDEDVAIGEKLRKRLIGNVQFLQASDESYAEIVEELLKSEAVNRDIEKRKVEAVAATNESLKSERDRLANLRKERVEIEASIKSLKAEAAKRSRDVDAAVKKAFRHAAEHELETLGQLALLKTLTEASPPAAAVQPQIAEAAPGVEFLDASNSQVSRCLLLIGFAPDRAQFIEKLMLCAKQTGAPVILEGIGANRLARKFAAGLTGGRAAVIEVPIGVHSSEVTNHAIGSGADVLAFTSANLSCPTGYAQPVLAGVVDKAIEPKSGTGPLSIFSGVTGPMALPWPVELQAVALKVPLDRETAEPGAIDFSPIQKKLWARLEQTAEVNQMNGSEIEAMRRMFGVIDRG